MTLIEGALMNGGPDFNLVLVPELGALAQMRREVAARLRSQGLPSATVDDVLLVLSELCANAIEATGPGHIPVLVRVQLGGSAVVVEVENMGPPFDYDAPLARRLATTDAERGRGLVVVEALAATLTLGHHDGRCIVQAVMPPR